MVNFSIPGQLTLQKDQNGVVTGIPEATDFKYSTGSLTVQGDGSFTGSVPDQISGTTAPGEQGTVVMYLDGTNGPGSIVFNANATADFMTAGGVFGGNSQELILGLRAPASISAEELAGLWNMQAFQTPNRLVLSKNLSNQVVQVDGLEQFQTLAGTMTIATNGTFNGNMGGAFTGNVNNVSGGAINITVYDQSSTNSRTLFINTGKDLMAMVEGEFNTNNNYQNLLIFSKAPTNLVTSEAAGQWRVVNYDAPLPTQVKNLNGQVIGLNNKDGFGSYSHPLIIGSDGYFWVQGDSAHGSFSAGANGLIYASLQSPEGPFGISFYGNAGKNIITSAATRSSNNELLIATRSAAWPGPLQNFALAASTITNGVITIEWAAAPDAALQVSSDFISWLTLTNTLGQHTYSEPANNTSPRHFRVKQPAP